MSTTTTNDDYRSIDPLLSELDSLPDADVRRRRLRNRIVTRCLPLANHIALRFKGRGETVEDLEQVARIGLINAVNRFDPARGPNFLSFAIPTIMGEVRRYFRDRTWSLKVPRPVKENHVRISESIERATNRLGRRPNHDELAAEMGVSRRDLAEALLAESAYSPASIDAPIGGGADENRRLVEQLPFEERGYESVDQSVSVAPLIAALPEAQRNVLRMRFFDEMTQSQIARRIGCSQMQVSRMLSRTIASLRAKAQPA